MKREKLVIYLLFPVIVISISSASILVLMSGASAVACAFWRLLISTLIIFTIAFIRKAKILLDLKDLALSAISGFFLAIHFLLWMESLFLIPVSVSTTVVVTYPLISAFIDKYFFKEKLTLIQIVGLISAFIGVTLFMHPRFSGEYSVLGVFMALGGSFAAAVYFSLGRYVRKRRSTTSYTIVAYSSSTLFLYFFSILLRDNVFKYIPESLIYFILLSLLPMIGGHTLMNYALKYMKTSAVTSVALLEPIGASILAYVFLGQYVDVYKAIIMCIVILSVSLTVFEEAWSNQGFREN
ncbi:MAG: EamA family transporter [Desulfurococcales archaeon ex4484_217_2]|nr:MAG: EamA family transporter [Desulfurococcales archaeon ex4484_217_2]